MQSRLEKLKASMAEYSIDVMLITDTVNLRYFTGFTGSAGFALVGDGFNVLVTDFRYTKQASIQAECFDIYDVSEYDLSRHINDTAAVGFENNSVSYADFVKFSKKIKRLINTDNMLQNIRSVKDSFEIECIEKAAKIADMAFSHIIGFMKEGMTEKEVALELEFFMRKSGADGLSFEPIVAAGPRGAMPHARAGETKLKKGDLVVMDYGCTVNGYCSDMTRTVAIGDISAHQKEVYETVKKVQAECLSMVREGAVCSDIHNHSYDVLNKKYPKCYGHGLGHGVGLYIHEGPSLNSRCTDKLASGNVVTVEPGVYINDDCGVRIEDLVVVTKDGCRILSKSTKELVKIQ